MLYDIMLYDIIYVLLCMISLYTKNLRKKVEMPTTKESFIAAISFVCGVLVLQFAENQKIDSSKGIEAIMSKSAILEEKLAEANRKISSNTKPNTACLWKFKSYVPSPWENFWVKNVKLLQDNVCEEANKEVGHISEWVKGAKKNIFANPFELPSSTFSQFHFVNTCTGEELVDYIEPLAGLTRHPYYCLKGAKWLVNKDYLIASWNVSRKLEISPSGYTPKALYFDLGASFYDSGFGGASQSWFIETYEKRGVSWKGIFAWEATPQDSVKTWNLIPAKWKPYYHWYNIPVSSVPGDADNALRYISEVARPEDYVLLKVDIDHSETENAIVHQLLASDELLGLVDEIYYEHHVRTKPMHKYWARVTKNSNENLSHTYNMFSELRKKGLLAHSWV